MSHDQGLDHDHKPQRRGCRAAPVVALTIAIVVVMLLLGPATVLAAEEESPVAGRFSPTGSLNEARGVNTATLLPDGRVFVLGGGFSSPSAAEVWDPVTGVFSSAGVLTWGRAGCAAALLPDGRVLIVGGQRDEAWSEAVDETYFGAWDLLRVAETWDPLTYRFRPAGILNESRVAPSLILLPDGRVLVIGGEITEYNETSAELWGPVTASSRRPMPAAFERVEWLFPQRWAPTETLLSDGRVLVVGGGDPYDFGWEPVEAQAWDPATDTFAPAGSLAMTRSNHTATLLPDGRVLVIGGWGGTAELATAEIRDPETETFGPTGSLDQARSLHTATLLADGRVLVIGGTSDDEPIASAEIWDPATAAFSPAGSLDEARHVHTATLLADGRVLVVGGGWSDELTSAEIWGPAPVSEEE